MEENNKTILEQVKEQREKSCKRCGKPFYVDLHSYSRPAYCSDECRKASRRDQAYAHNLENRNAVTKTLTSESVLGVDYVECPICHEKHAQITSTHFKRHGYQSIAEVMKDFPGLQVTSQKMKSKYSGDNNPNSKAKTTMLKRQQASAYSIEHYLKKYNGDEKLANEALQQFKDSIDRSEWNVNTRVQYFINQGMTEEAAKEALHQRQVANGLEWYVKKYGEEEGTRRYQERIDKWCKSALTGKSHSQIADYCIQEIVRDAEGLLYGDNEFTCKSPLTKYNYKVDLTNPKNHKMIEFFGDYWHCNPEIYTEDYIRKKRRSCAKDVWEHDRIRLENLRSLGFDVMVIWERDYKRDHDNVVAAAKRFIFENDERNN